MSEGGFTSCDSRTSNTPSFRSCTDQMEYTDITQENLNKCTVVFEDKAKKRDIFLFDYINIFLNRIKLKELRDNNEWNLIQHPLVFNYINETLLNCAWVYTFHILFYFTFLFILCMYIYADLRPWLNVLLTFLNLVFFFLLIIKVLLKCEKGRVSFWFIIYAFFTFSTIFVIFALIWIRLYTAYERWNEENMNVALRLLPIITIILSWIQCLHILRKTGCGLYIMMMIALIWIITLTCFAFSFHLVMKGSKIYPWEAENDEVFSAPLSMFQSFTKITAMMVGELEANDILKRQAWIASLLLISFEIITVILLMNLMISLAVGDVSELRLSSEQELLRVKTNYCIDALHVSEYLFCFSFTPLHLKRVNNILVIKKNDTSHFSKYLGLRGFGGFPLLFQAKEKVHDINLNAKDVKFFSTLICHHAYCEPNVNKAVLRILANNDACNDVRPNESLIQKLKDLKKHDSEGVSRRQSFIIRYIAPMFKFYKQWLIGLNMKALSKNVEDNQLIIKKYVI